MKGAPEGGVLKNEFLERERQSLKAMRTRWKLRGWHFTPLDNLDGENDVIDSLYRLHESPLCGIDIDKRPLDSNVATLIEDLEDLYRRALLPWEKFRTVFECRLTKRDYLRWPYGTYSAEIRNEARYRFWELKTTTRFSVNEIPNIQALQRVNWPFDPITVLHVASLAAMVCIVESIEALEGVLSNWKIESRPYLSGKPFEWLALNDPEYLESAILEVLESANEREFYSDKIRDALDSKNQAELWLSQANTLDFHDSEIEKLNKRMELEISTKIKAEISAAASKSARLPRGKATSLTVQAVADHIKSHPGEKLDAVIQDLAEKTSVSASTIYRRLAEAKKQNLLS
ncbi:MAG: hypothetical protein KGN32_01495 [Burkholderiales bacterium]|nr:hypothetical protein [Burkholderiales bacterium]